MASKYGRQVTFEVATLGSRRRFRDSEKAKEFFRDVRAATFGKNVWLEEWHGNKMVSTRTTI